MLRGVLPLIPHSSFRIHHSQYALPHGRASAFVEMRAYLPDYELVVPRTLTDALALLRDEPGVWRPLAGGTDLMVLLEAGKLEHKNFFSVWNLPELRGVEASDEYVTLGGLTTYTDVRRHAALSREFPM